MRITEMCKVLLEQVEGWWWKCGTGLVNTRVIGITIHEFQPIGTQEIDSVVNMYSAQRMDWRIWQFVLMFNTRIYPWPVNYHSCQVLHTLEAEMTYVENLQHFWLQAGWYHHMNSLQKTPVGHWQGIYRVTCVIIATVHLVLCCSLLKHWWVSWIKLEQMQSAFTLLSSPSKRESGPAAKRLSASAFLDQKSSCTLLCIVLT